MTPILTTDRLSLRPRAMADAEQIAALIGDYDVARMLYSVPYPYTLEDAREWVSGSLGKPGDLTWVLDDGTGAVGVASLNNFDGIKRTLGFWLGKPYWGRGFMSEVVRTVITWAFDEGGLDRIESSAFMDNIASRRLHAKFGFTEGEGALLDAPARGEPAPTVTFSLSREDWTPTP